MCIIFTGGMPPYFHGTGLAGDLTFAVKEGERLDL